MAPPPTQMERNPAAKASPEPVESMGLTGTAGTMAESGPLLQRAPDAPSFTTTTVLGGVVHP